MDPTHVAVQSGVDDPTYVAFDAVAADYDRQFTDTALGRLLRERVYRLAHYPALPGAAALELNCGTGADAVWLARRGFRVLATDISPEMVGITKAKLMQAGLGSTADAVVCNMTQLGTLADVMPKEFDLVWSNFGGLNCLSPDNLRKLQDDLRAVMAPNATLTAVVMGRFCLWETLYFLLKGQPSQAFRRLKKGGVLAPTGAPGSFIHTWYYSPAMLQRYFPHFTVTRLYPIGFWLPPSYLEPFFGRYPRFLRVLNGLERQIGGSWLAGGADHFMVRMIVRHG